MYCTLHYLPQSIGLLVLFIWRRGWGLSRKDAPRIDSLKRIHFWKNSVRDDYYLTFVEFFLQEENSNSPSTCDGVTWVVCVVITAYHTGGKTNGGEWTERPMMLMSSAIRGASLYSQKTTPHKSRLQYGIAHINFRMFPWSFAANDRRLLIPVPARAGPRPFYMALNWQKEGRDHALDNQTPRGLTESNRPALTTAPVPISGHHTTTGSD